MRTRCFLLAAALAAGCGARTVSDDYRDGGADTAVLPDRPPVDDQPLPCPDGQTRCGGVCVNLTSDVSNCGACGSSCGPGGVCSGGTCTGVACPSPLTNCRGACVDLSTDLTHCGACGNACGRDAQCRNGVCISSLCRAPFTNCGGTCVDTSNSTVHCGSCDNACPVGSVCSNGQCLASPTCLPPRSLCAGVCTLIDNDPRNCGACGNVCAAGQACVTGLCRATPGGTTLRIDALLPTNCRSVEHAMATGDDRGGIAYGGSQVFYTGDGRTVAFDAETLAVRAVGPQRLDGIFGEVTLGLPFTLASNTTPLDERTSILDALLQVSADGTPGRTAIPLGTTAFLDRARNDVGIFAGALRAVVTQGSRAWVIDGSAGLAAPRVTTLTIPPIAAHVACESWAFWGVAEFFDGQQWVAYVRDNTTIVRQNLLTGAVETIATFPSAGLADMCSFTVAPTRGRWYFHHEGRSALAGADDENLGYCDARIRTR